MPTPNDGESRDSFVARCTKDPEVRSQPGVADADDPNKAAIGRCEGIFDEHEKKERDKKQSAETNGASLKRNPLPETPEWRQALATTDKGGSERVDREKNVIKGYVVAQEGPFKSQGRGEFDKPALRTIKKLMEAKPNGLKSRFGHPTMSDDGLGKFLGRAKNPRMDTIMKPLGDGRFQELACVRADLHLDPSSFTTPYGSLGAYVMDLADSDSDAFSSSLVLQAEQEFRLDKQGRPVKDDDGDDLPPLWRPTALHASDVVDTGDAVDGFLSAGGVDALPDAVIRRGTELLDKQFPGASRETIKARCRSWLDKYLNLRFGDEAAEIDVRTFATEGIERQFALKQEELAEVSDETEDGDDDEALRLLLELGE